MSQCWWKLSEGNYARWELSRGNYPRWELTGGYCLGGNHLGTIVRGTIIEGDCLLGIIYLHKRNCYPQIDQMLFLNFAIYKASASFSQNKFSQLVAAIDHFQKEFPV